MNTVSVRAV